MNITTQFEFRQRVYIPELEKTGTIQAIYVSEHGGLQYSVRYFHNMESKVCYFYEHEITADVPGRGTAISLKP